jgi:hypothetical protein
VRNRRLAASIGFTHQDHSSDAMEVIKKSFTPEFRNRLDTIIQFGRLSHEVIKSVVDKFLTELQAQLEDKRVLLEVTDAARGWLAAGGYDCGDGCSTNGAPDPGQDQASTGGGDPLWRVGRTWRCGAHRHQGRRDHLRVTRPRLKWPDVKPQQSKKAPIGAFLLSIKSPQSPVGVSLLAMVSSQSIVMSRTYRYLEQARSATGGSGVANQIARKQKRPAMPGVFVKT